ncbi:MAG: hypothetical protein HYS45_00320 [Parcubacteria group bacterium]|nr:hypothetical protein [Parcubacteria group bacterium]
MPSQAYSQSRELSRGLLLDKLKQNGYTVYALEQSKKSHSIGTALLSKTEQAASALVLGNEVKGLSPAILKRADRIIEIPMAGRKESLNVAVAFGIAAYRLTKHH